MKAYVIHMKQSVDRIAAIIGLLCRCKQIEDVEIIMSESSCLKFCPNPLASLMGFPRGILPSQESLYHKQFRALEKIAKGGEPSIIVEDDVDFDPDKMDEFIASIPSIPEGWGFVFFGVGLPGHREDGPSNVSFSGCINSSTLGSRPLKTLNATQFIKTGKSNCTDSMLVHHKAAEVISGDLRVNGAHYVTDWDLNYRFIKHSIDVYWRVPGLTQQGSMSGKYKSMSGRENRPADKSGF